MLSLVCRLLAQVLGFQQVLNNVTRSKEMVLQQFCDNVAPVSSLYRCVSLGIHHKTFAEQQILNALVLMHLACSYSHAVLCCQQPSCPRCLQD